MRRRGGWLALALLFGGAATALGGGRTADDAKALAGVIDRHLAARWAEAKVEPAPPADDAEFLRRVTLDLIGRVPAVSEVRAFVDDPAADKRERLVDRLLASPAHVAHAARTWRALLIPETSNDFQVALGATDLEAWLRGQITAGSGYDAIVRQVLTVPINGNRNIFNGGMAQSPKPTPVGFITAKEGKPENLAAATTRLFLGIRLECAQCHDHPFAKWKRDEFWGVAAFFGGVRNQAQGDAQFSGAERPDVKEIAVPGTERKVKARYLDGSEPQWKPKVASRAVLADWVTSPDNPYFAKAAVNRTWAEFFGTGLIDPVDDMEVSNPASHPELLDELARRFAARKFDMDFLVRAITLSRAYGLSSRGYSPGQDDPRLFARAALRGLSPRQLYDSYVQATGVRREQDLPPFFFGGDSPRKDFLERFANNDAKPTEVQTSILQALTLMNGRLASDATSLAGGGTLPAVAELDLLDPAGKVEALFLATVSRRPRPEESARLVEYVKAGGPTKDPKQALADVFWALINSAEFVLNH